MGKKPAELNRSKVKYLVVAETSGGMFGQRTYPTLPKAIKATIDQGGKWFLYKCKPVASSETDPIY
jgi:hypothetical protein